jgi:hypothetical protein
MSRLRMSEVPEYVEYGRVMHGEPAVAEEVLNRLLRRAQDEGDEEDRCFVLHQFFSHHCFRQDETSALEALRRMEAECDPSLLPYRCIARALLGLGNAKLAEEYVLKGIAAVVRGAPGEVEELTPLLPLHLWVLCRNGDFRGARLIMKELIALGDPFDPDEIGEAARIMISGGNSPPELRTLLEMLWHWYALRFYVRGIPYHREVAQLEDLLRALEAAA